jgi:hypothetical protein
MRLDQSRPELDGKPPNQVIRLFSRPWDIDAVPRERVSVVVAKAIKHQVHATPSHRSQICASMVHHIPRVFPAKVELLPSQNQPKYCLLRHCATTAPVGPWKMEGAVVRYCATAPFPIRRRSKVAQWKMAQLAVYCATS